MLNIRPIARFHLILAAMLCAFAASPQVQAESFNVGGQSIEIQTPDGYVHLGPSMNPLFHRIFSSRLPPDLHLIALYVTTDHAELIEQGKPPDDGTLLFVATDSGWATDGVSREEGIDFIDSLARDFEDEALDKDDLAEDFQRMSDRISDEFDFDYTQKPNSIKQLPLHYRAEDAFSTSQIISTTVTANAQTISGTFASTASYLYVKNNVLYLFLNSPVDDIHLSRHVSLTLLEQIRESNQDKEALRLAAEKQADEDRKAAERVLEMLAKQEEREEMRQNFLFGYWIVTLESVVVLLLIYAIGAAIFRNLFHPKISIAPLILGFFPAALLTPAMSMLFSDSVTWRDLSDNAVTGSIAAAALVLGLGALFRSLVSGRQGHHSASPSLAADSVVSQIDPSTLDTDTQRKLASIQQQVEVGLISEDEAALAREQILQSSGNHDV